MVSECGNLERFSECGKHTGPVGSWGAQRLTKGEVWGAQRPTTGERSDPQLGSAATHSR